MKTFKPEFVLVSAGFDAHRDDPEGGLKLTADDYGELTRIVCGLADRYCDGMVVSVLEGGYNLKALGESVGAHMEEMGRDAEWFRWNVPREHEEGHGNMPGAGVDGGWFCRYSSAP
jgi:acetoin utilization deacetylase AcuC-like enzyme